MFMSIGDYGYGPYLVRIVGRDNGSGATEIHTSRFTDVAEAARWLLRHRKTAAHDQRVKASRSVCEYLRLHPDTLPALAD